MPYKFFSNSERTWQAMFGAIKGAQKSIYFEMYMFEIDIKIYDFSTLIKDKAKSGVKVKIILDNVGSRNLSNTIVNAFKESGVEIFFMNYFWHRTHRKILVVDERVAFIGGVNFSQNARLWNDLTIQIEGSLMKHVVKSFAKVYKECGGQDPELLAKIKVGPLKKADIWLVEHFPVRKNFSLKKVYKRHLNLAKHSVILLTPYFTPKQWFVKVLREAVERGVNVEVLMPASTDHFLSDRVNYFYMYKLSRLGVKFYIQPSMNHAKAMIIDEREAIVGSHNLDFLSFEFNSEIGVFVKKPEVVKSLLEITEEWKSQAYLFDPKTYKPSWFDYILSPIIRLFSIIY